jgi:hypothetical protein
MLEAHFEAAVGFVFGIHTQHEVLADHQAIYVEP